MRAAPAIVVFVLALLAAAAPAWGQPNQPISEEARKEFAKGVELLEDPQGPRYEPAYEAFKRAYAATPTPKILSNLGLCAMMLERDGEAIDAYERYLREVKDIDPRERQKIEKDLETLRARAADLSIEVTPAAATVIDTRTPKEGPTVVNRYPVEGGKIELRIHAGKHRIQVEAADHQTESWSFEIEGGGRHERKVELRSYAPTPAPPSPAPPPTPPAPSPEPAPDQAGGGLSIGTIAAIAATGVLAVGAGVTGGLALKFRSDYDNFAGDREDAESHRSTGEALNITTDVLIGCAAAAAAVSVVLIVLDLTGDSETESAAVSVSPSGGASFRF